MMSKHHDGVIIFAQEELNRGVYGPALELASAIQKTQHPQLDRITAVEPGA